MAVKANKHKTGVINDPLSQTHGLASSEHCFRLKFVLFCQILKNVDGRTDGQHMRKQLSLPAVPVGRPSGSKCIHIRTVWKRPSCWRKWWPKRRPRTFSRGGVSWQSKTRNKTGVINDPLGQPTRNKPFPLYVLFFRLFHFWQCKYIQVWANWRTDGHVRNK